MNWNNLLIALFFGFVGGVIGGAIRIWFSSPPRPASAPLPAPAEWFLYKLKRGSRVNHLASPFFVRRGNFSIVTDAPELRYHDGVTPGGVPIPLPLEVWRHVLDVYAGVGAEGPT